jgi:hypothetical protein
MESTIFTNLKEPFTVVELKIFSFVQAILAKKNWQTKLEDSKILEKWKTEAKVQHYENSMLEYMLNRLKFEIKLNKNVIVSPFHKIFQSDELIDKETKSNFLKSLKSLEKMEKDWHPQSRNQVLDLVHPSLNCLVYGRTYVTKEPMKQRNVSIGNWSGEGDIFNIKGGTKEEEEEETPMTPDEDDYEENPDQIKVSDDFFTSKKFQWLPADVLVNHEGKVEFQSYINNLHPLKHKSLYRSLEIILEKFIPMFEKVLGYERPPIIGIQYHNMLYEEFNSKFLYPEDYDNDEEIQPQFFSENFVGHTEELFRLKGTKKHSRQLQVIVKLANIELTPENPSYEGGQWHMEGMMNENIVATGIYYYSSHNITESNLSFRQAIRQPNDYGQDWGSSFGVSFQSELNQQLGYINTIQDRCIAFPNEYQHKVSPFELEDKTKKGFRKILVFFLVDPNKTIISTARVPPQQKDWMANVHDKDLSLLLPSEVLDVVLSFLPPLMNIEEAKDFRIKLMDERRVKVKTQEGYVFKRSCSLCEH